MLYWFTAQVFHWQLEHHAKHYLALVKVEGCTRQSSVMFITQHHYFYTPPFVAFLRFTRPRVATGDGIIISLDEWAGIMFMLRWDNFSLASCVFHFFVLTAHTLCTQSWLFWLSMRLSIARLIYYLHNLCVCVWCMRRHSCIISASNVLRYRHLHDGCLSCCEKTRTRVHLRFSSFLSKRSISKCPQCHTCAGLSHGVCAVMSFTVNESFCVLELWELKNANTWNFFQNIYSTVWIF